MASKPNILIVMTDHQRGDTVLPGHRAILPNMRRLAQQGVTFGNAYCPSPHCCPSRATFHTGLYPSQHGVWNNVLNDMALSRGLLPGVRCWSQDLAASGYQMAYCGKWHISAVETPRHRGWEEVFVSATAPTRHGGDWERYRQQAAHLNTAPGPTALRVPGQIIRPGYGDVTLYGRAGGEHANEHDAKVTAAAIDTLPRLTASGEPWCLYVGFIGPHDPYHAPGRCLDLYDRDEITLPASFTDRLDDKPRIYRRMRESIFGQLSEREVRDAIWHYLAYCTWLDEQLGLVLRRLDELGGAENTLVLFCSDHGDYCGDHGLFAKGIPAFRGAYHVPAIVRWPGGVSRPGSCVDEFVSLADVAPTLREVAGVDAPVAFPGASLVPFLRGVAPGSWRNEVHTQTNGVELYFVQRSITTQRWKYVFNGFDYDELYDRAADPHEMVNLADAAGCRDVKLDLCRRVWRFASQVNDPAINEYVTVGLAPVGPAAAFVDPPVG